MPGIEATHSAVESGGGTFYVNGYIDTRTQDWALRYAYHTPDDGSPMHYFPGGNYAHGVYYGGFYANGMTVEDDEFVPADNPANITVTAYDASGVTIEWEPQENYNLEINFVYNRRIPVPEFVTRNKESRFNLWRLQDPVTFGREYQREFDGTPFVRIVRGTAAITTPDDYKVFFGDRTTGGHLSAFFNVGARNASVATTDGVQGFPAQSAEDAKSMGVTSDLRYTEIQCVYAHPALIDFDDTLGLSLLAAAQTPFSGLVTSFYGAQFEFKYDANITESFQGQKPAPYFIAKDSLGRVSSFYPTPENDTSQPWGTTYLSYKNVTAIRFRNFENLRIEGGTGTIDDPFILSDEEFELHLNAPASFAPLGSVLGESVPSRNYNTIHYSLSRYREEYNVDGFLGIDTATGSTPSEIVTLSGSGEGNYQLVASARIGKTEADFGTADTDSVGSVLVYFSTNSGKTPFVIHPAGFILSAEKSGANTLIKHRTGTISTKETISTLEGASPIALERRDGYRQLDGSFAGGSGEIYLGAKSSDGSSLHRSLDNGNTFTKMALAFDNTYKTHDFELLFGNLAGAVASKGGAIYFKVSYDSGESWEAEVEVGEVPQNMKSLAMRQHTVNGKITVTITDSTTCQFESNDTGATWEKIS